MSNKKNNKMNEVKNTEEKKEVIVETNELSMFELMKMIEHNTKKIAGLSAKIDRLQNINEELKEQLKSKIENI